ncbi:hypothetical protein QM306_41130, partial [Burkholderia cenocepacia]|nr:hypothetical protein [Burkholderia cenocepacia]
SLGNGAPVLLVIEDVQWLDRSTEEFLAYLQHSPRGRRRSTTRSVAPRQRASLSGRDVSTMHSAAARGECC